MDQYRGWRRLDRWVPDELLGAGGPLQHRGLTTGGACRRSSLLPPLLPGPCSGWRGAWWSAGSATCSGTSPSAAPTRSRGRGPGIPVWPWWGHVGVGLDTGGWLEGLTAGLVLPAALVWQAWGAGRAGGRARVPRGRPLLAALQSVAGQASGAGVPGGSPGY